MRKYFILIFMALFLLLPLGVSAHAGHMLESGEVKTTTAISSDMDMEGLSISTIVEDIMRQQGVSDINQIDCNKIDEDRLEELGDALMEEMHPGEAHTLMDKMMGGEGSESLRSMHILMARRYLGCRESGYVGRMGMMGDYNGMMNGGRPYGNDAVKKDYWPFSGMMGVGMGIFWLFIIGLAGLLIKVLFLNSSATKARAILAERYAKGELSRQEYEEMKTQL